MMNSASIVYCQQVKRKMIELRNQSWMKELHSNTCLIFKGFVNGKESNFNFNLIEKNTNPDERLSFVLMQS